VSPATLFQQLNWLNTNLNALLDVPAPSNNSVVNAPFQTRHSSPPTTHDVQSSDLQHNLNDSFRKDKKIYVERPLDPVPKAETPPLKVDGDDQDHGSEESSANLQQSDDDELSIKMASTSLSTPPQPVRSGTEIRFPDLRLENIALLRCVRMFLMVKCNRCNNTVEIENIVPDQAAVDSASNGSEKNQRWLPCPTCSTLIGALFKGNYLHANAVTLGLLQLASCTPFDLLPSTYIATCTNCMEPHIPIKLTVHDQPKSTVCRNCHSKMSIGIPSSQFVRIGSGTGSKELHADPNAVLQLKRKKQPKQELGLVVGQPLPHQGACDHYRKSRRWFRFSCCNRIHPCDRCHDDKEDHKVEVSLITSTGLKTFVESA
jgi:CHY zinc finger